MARAGTVEEEAGAAVLPDDASLGQHAAGAVFEIDRLDEADGNAVIVDGAEPDGIALVDRRGPSVRRFAIDAGGEIVEYVFLQIMRGVFGHGAGIADDAITHEKGLLGGFDDAVQISEVVGLLDVQAIEQREDHQRCEALGGRWKVIELAAADLDRQRRAALRFVGGKIGGGDGGADAGEVSGEIAGDAAVVEIIGAVGGETIERVGQRRKFHQLALTRGNAIDEELIGKAGYVFQFVALGQGEFGLALGDDEAVGCVPGGIFKQARQGKSPADLAVEPEHFAPA